jgi:hypothetical protein
MKNIQKYFYLLTGLTAFIIYLLTIAPSVLQIDTGELATTAITLGIAHPTGYPLFTIMGYVFSLIPFPFTKIFQLNLLAAIYCASAVSIFSYTAKFILDNLSSFQFVKAIKHKSKKKKENKINEFTTTASSFELNEITKIISAFFSGLILAFSKTFWFQSTSVEVYSLHLLLMMITILLLLKAFIYSGKNTAISKYWILFSIALACGFSNHLTTILIIPGVAFLYFANNGFNQRSIKQIVYMLLIFFPILFLIYSYLPIRAAQNPTLNWGNPVDLERLLRHFSAGQYRVWIFSSKEVAVKQFNYFLSNLPTEFLLSTIIAAAGFIISFLYAKKFFVFNFLVFLSAIFYSINYDIVDIDSYFLLAYISLALFAVFGIAKLIQFAIKNKITLFAPAALIIIFIGFQVYKNFDEINQSKNFVFEDYTKTILNSVPKNSIVFSYQWDYFISSSYYFQHVENFRKDVIIIDKELLRRSWYYNQLNRNYPGILYGIEPEVNQFLDALKPFEREENEKTNNKLLENLYRRIMTGLITSNIAKHNYFIAPELVEVEMRNNQFQLPKDYSLVPYMFLFKVVNTNEYVEAPLPNFILRLPEIKDKYITEIEKFVGKMLISRALYELNFNKIDKAKIYTKKAVADFPDIILPQHLSNLIKNY